MEGKKSTRPLGHNSNGTSMNVVVVDDDFTHRRVMVQILKSVGFNVIAEGMNGEEAIFYVEQHNPMFLFMDYHMPRMDGYTALKHIHEAKPNLKVVMFTTENEKDKVKEVLQAGAADYVIKPIDRAIMLEKLERLTGRD